MSQQMQVFVSHAHADDGFCRAVVEGLRGAGADVWYDEHNLGSGQLMTVIQRELGRRPIVLVILSKAAFASAWVRREVTWAYELLDRDPSRLILPVTAGPIERSDFDPLQGWLFLHDFKRIEAPGMQPYPVPEAVQRVLHALALTPAGGTPSPTATAGPQPTETADDLLARGKVLQAQGKHADALPLFERATQLAPHSFEAWFNLGLTLVNLQRYEEVLTAYDQAIALDPHNARAWNNKGAALIDLRRYAEALAACQRAISLDPDDTDVWTNTCYALNGLQRYEEALTACGRAIVLDPDNARAWNNKAWTLYLLHRHQEAVIAVDRSLALDPSDANGWATKGEILNAQRRYDDALLCVNRALVLDPALVDALAAQAVALRGLGRTDEAEAAEHRAKELGG